jgi:hypothetical protein
LLLKSTPAPIFSQLVKQINVLDAVNWIHHAKKKNLPETVKKCFLKAGFPAHASADTQDMYTSPVTLFINEVSHKKVVVPRCSWLD